MERNLGSKLDFKQTLTIDIKVRFKDTAYSTQKHGEKINIF